MSKRKIFRMIGIIVGSIISVVMILFLAVMLVIHIEIKTMMSDIDKIFDNQSASTFDGKFEWVSQVEKSGYNDMSFVNISIKDVENGSEVILSEFQYRTFDFKWIAWEPDTYNLWVYSADIGTYF